MIAAAETDQDSIIRDRMVIKVKGKKLDEFLAAGVQSGGTYIFDLFFDAEEKIGKDGEAYPYNKAVICTGFQKA